MLLCEKLPNKNTLETTLQSAKCTQINWIKANSLIYSLFFFLFLHCLCVSSQLPLIIFKCISNNVCNRYLYKTYYVLHTFVYIKKTKWSGRKRKGERERERYVQCTSVNDVVGNAGQMLPVVLSIHRIIYVMIVSFFQVTILVS